MLNMQEAKMEIENLALEREVKSPAAGRVVSVEREQKNGLFHISVEILAQQPDSGK